MLNRIAENGRKVCVSEIPSIYADSYRDFLNKLSQSEKGILFDFIRQSIVQEKELSVSSKFGSSVLNWNDVPLAFIYIACDGDHELSAKILGLLVMNVLIEDTREWFCTKTVLGNKPVASNYYWAKAA